MINRNFVVAIDLDETIWDLIKPMLKNYNLRYNDCVRYEDITDWDFDYMLKPECTDFWKEFSTEELITNLQIHDDLVEILKTLNMFARIYFVTSSHTETFGWKVKALKRQLPFFKDSMAVKLEDKSLFKCDVMIDDYEKNIAETSGVGLLIDKPWNAHSKFKTCTSRDAILKALSYAMLGIDDEIKNYPKRKEGSI